MTEELFKSALVGGFDKEEVLEYVERLRTENLAEQEKLKAELAVKDEKILQLNKRLELKDDQYARLEAEVRNKYQKYADHYEMISKLAFEAELKAEETEKEAVQKAEKILQKAEEDAAHIQEQARKEAREQRQAVQVEVDEKLAEGKKYYTAVQEEMNQIVDLINQAQSRFMESYKEAHRIATSMPDSLWESEEEAGEIGADLQLVDHMESLFGEEEN